jgi:hypothetical protein
MQMTKIEIIYAYIKTQNPQKLKEEIFAKLSGKSSENGVWKKVSIKSVKDYHYLQHTSEQLKNEGCIDLIPTDNKLYIYVQKRSDGTEDDIDLVSLFLGRFVTALLYHCSSIPHLVIISKKS